MKRVIIGAIRLYQKTISPDHGWFSREKTVVCRFSPTCSSYMIEAIEIHGIMAGTLLGTKRIARCHPWSDGGHDPVPLKPTKQKGAL